MGWLEGVWDGNSMLKCQHTYADFPAVNIPNADISAYMLEKQHNEYYKLKNCPLSSCTAHCKLLPEHWKSGPDL